MSQAPRPTSAPWASLETRDREELDDESRPARVPQLSIACHGDLQRIGEYALLDDLLEGRPALLSRLAPQFRSPGAPRARALEDPFLSRRPVTLEPLPWGCRVRSGHPSSRVLLDGAPVADEVDLTWAEIDAGVVIELAGRVTLLFQRRGVPEAEPDDLGLVGESEPMGRLRREIRAVAARAVPTLLRGETGTGKELVARAIHHCSPRRDRPFVTVNMAALPAATAVSQLFGHVRGAFTGAHSDHPGFFGQADGGTIFLDEVGEMSSDVQVALLRVLESGEVQPVGARSARTVDVRVISATDSDLETAIRNERFRGSLLHRLGGLQIELPALRDRREDIPRLLRFFLLAELDPGRAEERLAGSAADRAPWLPAPTMSRLLLASWPGNVRQLRNIAWQMVMHGSEASQIDPGAPWLRGLVDAPPEPSGGRTGPKPPVAARRSATPEASAGSRRPPLDEAAVVAALRANGFRLAATAKQLEISRTTLYALIERCPELRKAGDLSREEIQSAAASVGDDVADLAAYLQVSPHGLRRRLRELALC